jgi:hypothetical protein
LGAAIYVIKGLFNNSKRKGKEQKEALYFLWKSKRGNDGWWLMAGAGLF